MLNKLQILRYRNLNALNIEKMNRINIIAGQNNTGKTSVLEAIFLLSGGANPQLAMNINAFRGISAAAGAIDLLRDIFWKPLFYGLDMKQEIEISAQHKNLGQLKLSISLVSEEVLELPLDFTPSPQTSTVVDDYTLQLQYETEAGKTVTGRMRAGGPGIQVDSPNFNIPFPAIFLSSRVGNLQEDAARLGRLRKRKQGKLVTEAVKTVEPRLISVEDNSASGSPMIWADVGLTELIPLATMGEGMTRIARIVLAICDMPHGLVLIDEVENGFHHTILPKVWKIIERAAEKFDVQVVATTHSFECVEAAHNVLKKRNLKLHRLEPEGNEIHCISYSADAIDAAISHGLEVR